MCARYLGFFLLVWFPGVLHAQNAPQSCSTPSLNGGFFVPKKGVYSHETTLRYACNKGLKPAAEGWWATSTCLDGNWSHKPQCIDKKACIPLKIPNVKKHMETHRGWYEDRHTFSIICNNGYEAKSQQVTCENGTWTPVPACDKSSTACGSPPQIPHAVIILQGYQEVFAANSQVQYECENGYTVEGGDIQKTITCRDGEWTRIPKCRAGDAEVEPVGGAATSPDSRTQPASGGSSSSPRVNDREGSSRAPISRCGQVPVVTNAVVIEEKRTFVRYQCNVFYTHTGPQIVYCNSNGRWTQLPTCEVPAAPSCEMDPALYAGYLYMTAVEHIFEGHVKFIPCIWPNYYSRVECINGVIYYQACALQQ